MKEMIDKAIKILKENPKIPSNTGLTIERCECCTVWRAYVNEALALLEAAKAENEAQAGLTSDQKYMMGLEDEYGGA